MRHDWVGKMIHWEMCKKFKFDHTNKWYMHNPAPVLENDIHKLLWDFNIQTDHLIPARRLDLIIINKKKRISKIVDFAVLEELEVGGRVETIQIAVNGQNPETSPEDLGRRAVIQTPVKNHQLTLM